MSSPGLKPTVELRNTGPQPELVDTTTTRALVLSPLEARLLSLWDGICSASHLTDVARAHGLVIEGRQAAVFLERLSRAGFLAAPPTIDSGLVPDAPGLERLEDPVPKLRGDLLIEKPPGAKGVMRVTDPLKSRSFTLYDFELSIARLLDGRRTAGEVIEASNRLGIPVNLESLRKFVRQLRGYRFIDERALPPSEPAEAASSRDAWTPEQREMYETALRFWKQEKLTHALEYLAALLEVNPNLQEPKELQIRLKAELAGEGHTDLDFDSLHGVPNPLAPPTATDPDFLTLHATPATPAPAGATARTTGEHAAVTAPSPRPSKPSGGNPAVPAPAPSPSRPPPEGAAATPSRQTGNHPALGAPAPRPSKPSGSNPVVPAPAPSPALTMPEVPAPRPSKPSGSNPVVPAPSPALTIPEIPAPRPSKPSGSNPAAPAPAPSPSAAKRTGTSPAVPAPAPSPSATKRTGSNPAVPSPAASPSKTSGSTPAVPAPPPRPSKPTGSTPAVPAPAPAPLAAFGDDAHLETTAPSAKRDEPRPSRQTGDHPALAAPPPRPSKPTGSTPAVPAPAPAPLPGFGDDAHLETTAPSQKRDARPATEGEATAPAVAVPYSTPSQMLSHDQDPFRLYEPGAVMTGNVPPAEVEAPRPSTPSIIVEVELGAETTEPERTAPATEAAPRPPSPVESRPSPSAAQASEQRASAETQDDDDIEALLPRPSRKRWVVAAALGGVALVLVAAGAWLLRPVPRHFSAPAKLTAVPPGVVPAPRAGAVGPRAVADGELVKEGQPLGAMDDAAARTRIAAIEQRRAAIERRRAALKPAPDKKVKPAQKKAELAKKAHAAAATRLEKAEALPPGRRKAAVAKAKKAEAAANAKLKKAEAALEALTHAGELERLAKEAAELEQEAASLGEALAAPPFTAPAAGRLTWLKQPGDEVQAGDAVLQVDQGLWKVHADTHLALPPGIPVATTVTVGGASLEVRRLQVTDSTVDGLVQSPRPLAATGTLEVSAGERQAWELLVGSD